MLGGAGVTSRPLRRTVPPRYPHPGSQRLPWQVERSGHFGGGPARSFRRKSKRGGGRDCLPPLLSGAGSLLYPAGVRERQFKVDRATHASHQLRLFAPITAARSCRTPGLTRPPCASRDPRPHQGEIGSCAPAVDRS